MLKRFKTKTIQSVFEMESYERWEGREYLKQYFTRLKIMTVNETDVPTWIYMC